LVAEAIVELCIRHFGVEPIESDEVDDDVDDEEEGAESGSAQAEPFGQVDAETGGEAGGEAKAATGGEVDVATGGEAVTTEEKEDNDPVESLSPDELASKKYDLALKRLQTFVPPEKEWDTRYMILNAARKRVRRRLGMPEEDQSEWDKRLDALHDGNHEEGWAGGRVRRKINLRE
jgi:hypothetical protein